MARPISWTEDKKKECFAYIISQISLGRSLRSVLKDENTPESQMFYIWLNEDNELSKQYARATELRAEVIFDEILQIADCEDNDIITIEGTLRVNNDVIARDRLRVDARKWALSKMMPKKYGDKIDVTSDNEKIQQPFFGSNPLITAINDSIQTNDSVLED